MVGRGAFAGLLPALLLGIGVGFLLRGIHGRLPAAAKPRAAAVITGMIDIRPELRKWLKQTDCLFIIVTRPGERVPLAVKRVAPVSFPFLYTIGPQDRMLPGVRLEGKVTLTVRVDKDCQANPLQTGDLTGKPAKDPIEIPAQEVDVLIDTVIHSG